jgi:L-erythro-3,5-diaminohexanoate dehydrogenase
VRELPTPSDVLAARLGADRVVAPPGWLPQPAERLDASAPMRPFEFEVAVERLCLDSTSLRNIRERSDADPERMAARILEIVAARGKMHNPETGSGGVLLGTVAAVGERVTDPPAIGDRVVTLASLTLTALRLDAVTRIDPGSAQVEVRGTAYVADSAPWGPVPEDLPFQTVLELYDVYGAASHVRTLVPPPGGTICVLGTGHAGRLACAAARDTMEGGTVIAVDVDPAAVARLRDTGLCDIAVAADLRDPIGAVRAVREAGGPPADLTVVVVNATGCEPAAILLTAENGTVLFFSMATSFTTAALTADGMAHDVRMLIGSGYAPDTGAYALDLLRRSEPLRAAIAAHAAAEAA